MGRATEQVRVVLVSPSDVAGEREVAQTVVDELNRGVADDRGCSVGLWRWETHSRPGMHVAGSQGLIDELMDIRSADVVVGVFWTRFGTPTREADSGTEHELRRAWAAYNERGRPETMVYFCTRPYTPRTSAETTQWGRVLDFQSELPGEQLWWRYESVEEFQALLREHLTRYLLDRGSRAESRIRFNLPTVAAAFTGRDRELAALERALTASDRELITYAITGLGGVGKSQLAARYVQQHGDRYDIVIWVGAEDGAVGDFAQLAVKLGQPVKGLSADEQARLALSWLADCERPWLLVLDNVASAEQLAEILPTRGLGRVLITSRDRSLRQFGTTLTIGVFDVRSATAYLTERANRPDDIAAAQTLARALGYLPLALSHAAAYCQHGTSFDEYLELLRDLPARTMFDSHPELGYAKTVASTWKASIQAATATAPLAADVLQMAGHLGPDAIPKSLFEILVDADAAIERKRLIDALNALARYSLATVDDDTVGVHRLLQKVIRDELAAAVDHAARLRALAAVGKAFPTDVELPACWPVCEQLLPHVLALADTPPQDEARRMELIGLLARACKYLRWAESGRRGLPVAELAFRQAERLLGPEHHYALSARRHLARALHQVGRTGEAIGILESLVGDCERIAEEGLMLASRRSLARIYRDVGRIAESVAMFESLLIEYERIIGTDDHTTLATRQSLASTYRAAGRTAEAIAILEPLLSEYERRFGASHPRTLNTRNNLAGAYQTAGRTDQAITMFKLLLGDHERSLGADHPRTLDTRSYLAASYRRAGRVAESIAIYEALLGDQRRILGNEHPETLESQSSLADLRRGSATD